MLSSNYFFTSFFFLLLFFCGVVVPFAPAKETHLFLQSSSYPDFIINGKVLQNNEPLEGAMIQVFYKNQSSPLTSVTTLNTGKYKITLMLIFDEEDAEYKIVITKKGIKTKNILVKTFIPPDKRHNENQYFTYDIKLLPEMDKTLKFKAPDIISWHHGQGRFSITEEQVIQQTVTENKTPVAVEKKQMEEETEKFNDAEKLKNQALKKDIRENMEAKMEHSQLIENAVTEDKHRENTEAKTIIKKNQQQEEQKTPMCRGEHKAILNGIREESERQKTKETEIQNNRSAKMNKSNRWNMLFKTLVEKPE